ncbi:hypothetical protein C1H46_013445 [Malus baccata]|uniref:Uncharacterized protein n=1 Tax=Malus baccata TaxID=106549 RepID=A0A540MQ51_MALBA|nr:hypothetical protein C1H46_013445 [Malus baccata]
MELVEDRCQVGKQATERQQKDLGVEDLDSSTSSWDCNFWMKRTPEPSDRALDPHMGSYWPLQASMPPLQFGKMLEAITNVLPV